MSQGLAVNNDSGQLLISSDTTSLYFYGAAQPESVTGHTDYGGASFITYNTYTSKEIMPFVVPAEAGVKYGIVRTYRGGDGYWRVELMAGSAYAYIPELVIFTSADAEHWADRFTPGDRAYGLKVLRADGSTAFDSGAGQPLVIKSVLNVAPPYDPTPGGYDLGPSRANTYTNAGNPASPMFANFTMAMAERQYSTESSSRDCTGFSIFGSCIGYSDYTYTYDLYWGLYHSGVSVNGANYSCGWMTYTSGHYHFTDSSSGISIIIPIIPTGGGSSSSGMPPFTTSSVNIEASPLIVADRSFYPAFPVTTLVYPSPPAPTSLAGIVEGSDILVTMDMSATFPVTFAHHIYTRPTGTPTWIDNGLFWPSSYGSGYHVPCDPAYATYDVLVIPLNRYLTGANSATITVYSPPPPDPGGGGG